MSRFTSPALTSYIEKLREQAVPSRTDKRHATYVSYINCFLKYFGKERCMLVGSTAEELKLRWSKDGGDADFILISGKLDVPVECLEFREDTPCFVWVRGKHLQSALDVKLVEGKYLPAGLLRVVGPEAFTILRGLYTIITTNSDGVPGQQGRSTIMGIESNVGLAWTEFTGLKKSKDLLSTIREQQTPAASRGVASSRAVDSGALATTEKKRLWDILNFIGELQKPGSSGEHQGKFHKFAYNVRQLVESKKSEARTDVDPEFLQFVNELDISSDEEVKPKSFKVEYAYKKSKDFVPAFRVVGKLKDMDTWRNRHRVWPSAAAVDEIYNSELYVVSKLAPVKANVDKDFCLSFNQAELKLAQSLSKVQRDIMLILKSYLKGTISKYSDKMTTFQLKTALYWVSETADPAVWHEDRIMEAVKIVLQFIRDALVKQDMRHFFMPSNILAGLDGHFKNLLEAIDYILVNPVDCIAAFFNLNDLLAITTLDQKQLQCLARLYKDGGKQESVVNIEYALDDFQRGFDDSLKDANGEAPINEAIMHVSRLYLAEECNASSIKKKVDRWNLPDGLGQTVTDFANKYWLQFRTSAIGATQSSQSDTGLADNFGTDLFGLLGQYLANSTSDRREREAL